MEDGESVGPGHLHTAGIDAVGDLATRPDLPAVTVLDEAEPPRRVDIPRVASNPVARCLRRWVGVNEHLLDAVPGDRPYFTFAVVLAVFVAAIDGAGLGILLTMTVGQSSHALPIAVGIGFFFYILFLDLSILTPEPYNEVADVDGAKLRARRRRSWTRLAVAILLGFFVALGLTAAVFAQDVNRRAALERTAQIESATKRLRTEQAAVRAQALAAPSPEVTAAQAAQTQANDDLNRLTIALAAQRAECNAEINGTGGSGQAGQGPRADLKCTAATQLAFQVDAATTHLASTQAAVDTAIRRQTAAAAAGAAAVTDIKIPKPFTPGDLGPIDRITATHEALGNWEILVALVLIAIDCAPVLLKQTKGVTDYERLLGMHHARIVDGSGALARRRRHNDDAERKIDSALSGAYADAVVDEGVESMRRIAAERVRAHESTVVSRLWDETRRQLGQQDGPPVVDVRRVEAERPEVPDPPPAPVVDRTGPTPPTAGPDRPTVGQAPVLTSVPTSPPAPDAGDDPASAGGDDADAADGGEELSEEEAARRAEADPAWLARALTEAMQGSRGRRARR